MTEVAAAEPTFALRLGNAGDVPLICSSWLKSYRKAPAVAKLRGPVYFDSQRSVVERILGRASVAVACSQSDFADVYGYVVYESLAAGTVLHWLYVKQPFRGLGIARVLLSASGAPRAKSVQHSHETEKGRVLARALGSVLNPYLGGIP